MKDRDINIEVLRCAMMFVIVLGHMSAMGPYAGNKLVHAIFTLSYFATNAFVFISGWYGVGFKPKKIWHLIELGLYAAAVNFLLSKIATGEWTLVVSLGWFGNSYLALLLISPILNYGLDALDSRGMLSQCWCAITCASILSWLPTGAFIDIAPSGWSGNSTLALIYIYITGRVIAKSPKIVEFLTLKRSLFLCLLLGFVNMCWSGMAWVSHGNRFLETIFVQTRGNNSPLTIAIAFSVFMVFRQIKFPHFLSGICGFCAPSMMSIYLLHIGCSEKVGRSLFVKYAFVRANTMVGQILSTFFAAVFVYLVCLILDVARRQLHKYLESRGCR